MIKLFQNLYTTSNKIWPKFFKQDLSQILCFSITTTKLLEYAGLGSI